MTVSTVAAYGRPIAIMSGESNSFSGSIAVRTVHLAKFSLRLDDASSKPATRTRNPGSRCAEVAADEWDLRIQMASICGATEACFPRGAFSASGGGTPAPRDSRVPLHLFLLTIRT